MKKRLKLAALVLAIPLTAAAAYIFLLGVSGTVTIGTGEVHYVTAAGTTSDPCQSEYLSDQALDIGWDNPLPGQTCDITVVVGANGNTADMRLQGFSISPELIATLGDDCGKLVLAGDPSTYGILLTLEVGNAEPGSTVNFNGGFEWVPAEAYQVALCS